MDNKIYICAGVVLLFGLLALFAYNFLEIYEYTSFSPLSKEARENKFYVMERWLTETGHPVRVEKKSSPSMFSAIHEKTAVIFSKAGEWDNASEFLVPWITLGNTLVICLNHDPRYELDENLSVFLLSLGIQVEETSGAGEYWNEDIPDFSWKTGFIVDDAAGARSIIDREGHARLAEISIGEGRLIVTGYPVFMENEYLYRNVNALLTWRLTGERADSAGTLFVRERERAAGNLLFGKIMERGNLVPLGVSIFIVIVLGFWMVIPGFGVVFEEKQKSARPIRERFAAEISFLKRYKSLDYYLEVYDRELSGAGGDRERNGYSYREIINKLRRVGNETGKYGIGGDKT